MLSLSRSTFALLPLLALLAGCASNPYKRNYSSMLHERVPKGESLAFVGATGEPRLLSTNDIGADAVKLLEQGYFPVGRAKFREPKVDTYAALFQAREVGADIVIVKQKHVGSETQSMLVSDWTPDRSIVTNESTRVYDLTTQSTQIVDRQVKTVVEGEYRTRYENQSVDFYDHTAVFWKKTQEPLLGLFASDLGDEQRKAMESNKGAVIRAVVRRSPAYLADLFRGDVVRRFAGREVVGAEELLQMVPDQAGKKVQVEIWREGKTLTKTVTLRAR